MKKIIALLLILISSLVLCTYVKAEETDGSNEYEYEAGDFVAINNQTGVHYANFDGLSIHTVDHKNYNSFLGVKLTNLKLHDFTKYNALMIRFENASSVSLDVRVAYNHNVGDSNYGNRIEKDPSPFYTLDENGNVVYYASEERTGASHTTAFHTIKSPFNGWLILKIEDTNETDLKQLTNVDSLSIYGNQGKMWWGKWNIGDIYLTNLDFPADAQSLGGKVENKKLVWTVDFNKPNYTKEFYNWILGSTEFIDTSYNIAAVHEKEFNITTSYLVVDEEYEYNKNQMFKIPFSDELKNKYGMYDLSNLGGVVFSAENLSNKPFEFSLKFTRFRTEWVSTKESSMYLMPDDGYGYWSQANFIPKGFKGKVFMPYNNNLFVSYSEENSTESVPEFTYDSYAQFVVRIIDTENSGVHCKVHSPKYVSKNYIQSQYVMESSINGAGSYNIDGTMNYDVKNEVSLNNAIGLKINVKNNGSKSDLSVSLFEKKIENNKLKAIEITENFDGTIFLPFESIESSTGNNRIDGTLSKIVFEGNKLTVKGFSIVYQDGTESDVITSLEESKKFSITLDNEENGVATISKSEAFEGESLILTVTANEGYKVASIKINNRYVKLTDGKYTLEDIDQNVLITVTYKKIEENNNVDEPAKGCKSSITLSLLSLGIVGVVFSNFKKKENYD